MPGLVQEDTVQTKVAEDYLVNDGVMTQEDVLPLRPSYPSEPIEVLRERYEQDGYLFLKGIFPRDDVLSCRRSYFDFLSPTGVLEPGSDPLDGIYAINNDGSKYPSVGTGIMSGDDATAATFLRLAEKAHTEPWFLKFSHHPALRDFVAKFSGWGDNTKLLARSLLRNNTPVNKAIGVHYDQIFLRYGEPTSITAWVPLGDIDTQGGGLIYLERGQEIEAAFTEKAKQRGFSDEETRNAFNANMSSNGFLADGPLAFAKVYKRRWYVTAYEAGDAVLHKPHMIHASTINRDPKNKIRLGTDLRFVDSSKPYDTRWTNPFSFDDGI